MNDKDLAEEERMLSQLYDTARTNYKQETSLNEATASVFSPPSLQLEWVHKKGKTRAEQYWVYCEEAQPNYLRASLEVEGAMWDGASHLAIQKDLHTDGGVFVVTCGYDAASDSYSVVHFDGSRYQVVSGLILLVSPSDITANFNLIEDDQPPTYLKQSRSQEVQISAKLHVLHSDGSFAAQKKNTLKTASSGFGSPGGANNKSFSEDSLSIKDRKKRNVSPYSSIFEIKFKNRAEGWFRAEIYLIYNNSTIITVGTSAVFMFNNPRLPKSVLKGFSGQDIKIMQCLADPSTKTDTMNFLSSLKLHPDQSNLLIETSKKAFKTVSGVTSPKSQRSLRTIAVNPSKTSNNTTASNTVEKNPLTISGNTMMLSDANSQMWPSAGGSNFSLLAPSTTPVHPPYHTLPSAFAQLQGANELSQRMRGKSEPREIGVKQENETGPHSPNQRPSSSSSFPPSPPVDLSRSPLSAKQELFNSPLSNSEQEDIATLFPGYSSAVAPMMDINKSFSSPLVAFPPDGRLNLTESGMKLFHSSSSIFDLDLRSSINHFLSSDPEKLFEDMIPTPSLHREDEENDKDMAQLIDNGVRAMDSFEASQVSRSPQQDQQRDQIIPARPNGITVLCFIVAPNGDDWSHQFEFWVETHAEMSWLEFASMVSDSVYRTRPGNSFKAMYATVNNRCIQLTGTSSFRFLPSISDLRDITVFVCTGASPSQHLLWDMGIAQTHGNDFTFVVDGAVGIEYQDVREIYTKNPALQELRQAIAYEFCRNAEDILYLIKQRNKTIITNDRHLQHLQEADVIKVIWSNDHTSPSPHRDINSPHCLNRSSSSSSLASPLASSSSFIDHY